MISPAGDPAQRALMRRRPDAVYRATSRRRLRMGLIKKRLIKLGLEEWLPESIKDLREVTGGQQF